MYKMICEVKCDAPNCKDICRLETEWKKYPSVYPNTSTAINHGWFYQRQGYITNHLHVLVASGLYCPYHADLWKKYVEQIKVWDREQMLERKTFWGLTKSMFKASKPPPNPPWEK